MMPKGRLQICCKFCQVSASCHSSAMTPNNTADAPKTIRPYNAIFIQKKQRCRCFRPVAQARSFPLYVLPHNPVREGLWRKQRRLDPNLAHYPSERGAHEKDIYQYRNQGCGDHSAENVLGYQA